MKSTIKTLNPNDNNPDSGWGFIKNPDAAAAKNFFFTQAALKGIRFSQLAVGMEVEFDLADGPRGPQARNIRAIAATPAAPSAKVTGASSSHAQPRKPEAPATRVRSTITDAELIRLMEEDFEEDRKIFERVYEYRDREPLVNRRFHDDDSVPF